MGTHAELLNRHERAKIESKVNELYPDVIKNRFQIHGHFVVGLSESEGVPKLKESLLDLSLNHPKIGIGKVQVPETFVRLKQALENFRHNQHRPFISWAMYTHLALSISMPIVTLL